MVEEDGQRTGLALAARGGGERGSVATAGPVGLCACAAGGGVPGGDVCGLCGPAGAVAAAGLGTGGRARTV